MSDNGNGTKSECYVDVRCPNCRNIRTQACEGSNVRQHCRKCDICFEGTIEDGHFRLQWVGPRNEEKGKTRRRPVVTSVNPPTLIG